MKTLLIVLFVLSMSVAIVIAFIPFLVPPELVIPPSNDAVYSLLSMNV